MATPQEQRDARPHAMNTGSVERGPAEPGQLGRAATPGAAAEPALGASAARGEEAPRRAARPSVPADPDLPSSDEP